MSRGQIQNNFIYTAFSARPRSSAFTAGTTDVMSYHLPSSEYRFLYPHHPRLGDNGVSLDYSISVIYPPFILWSRASLNLKLGCIRMIYRQSKPSLFFAIIARVRLSWFVMVYIYPTATTVFSLLSGRLISFGTLLNYRLLSLFELTQVLKFHA